MNNQSDTRDQGFTIIELLIVLAITSVALSAIYSTFRVQQRTYAVQRQVAAMQQNLRAGMHMMVRDLKMAGCDPTDGSSGSSGAGFTTTNAAEVRFTRDINNNAETWRYDGDVNDCEEDITYRLYTDADGVQKLGRISPNACGGVVDNATQPVAEYIESLNFDYLDEDGVVTANADNIRSVRITMRARTSSNKTYQAETLEAIVNARNQAL